MKVAIYSRVSSEKQKEDKTIKSQLDELREACKEHQIVEEYIDDGYSGELLERPALDKLRDDAKEDKFEAVYILEPDRLSRDLANGIIVKRELEKQGIKVIFLNKDYSDEHNGDFYYKLEQLMAEKEKKEILDRFRRGKKHKAINGILVGHMPPFGYDYVKKSKDKNGYYKINQEEAKAIKEIFKRYLKLHSITALAKEMTNLGIYTTRKKSKVWRNSSINKILRNESYLGTTYWGKSKSIEKENSNGYRRQAKTGRIKVPREKWFPIKCPKIIDEKTFYLAQGLLEKNKKPYHKSKYKYLLNGFLQCICGSTYGGSQCRGYFYYRCNDRKRRHPLPRKCKAKAVKREIMEKAIWSNVYKLVTKPKVMFELFGLVSEKNNRGKGLEQEISELDKRLKKEEVKRDRLIEVYREGDITKEKYKSKIEASNKVKNKLEKEREDKQAMLGQIDNIPINKKTIREFSRLAKKKLKNLPFKKKKKFLVEIIDRIIYDDLRKKAKIIGKIPIGRQKVSSPLSFGILSPLYLRNGRNPEVLKFEFEVAIPEKSGKK